MIWQGQKVIGKQKRATSNAVPAFTVVFRAGHTKGCIVFTMDQRYRYLKSILVMGRLIDKENHGKQRSNRFAGKGME